MPCVASIVLCLTLVIIQPRASANPASSASHSNAAAAKPIAAAT
jgi:hypothetical protein